TGDPALGDHRPERHRPRGPGGSALRRFPARGTEEGRGVKELGLLKTARRRIERIGLPRAIQLRCALEFHGSRKGGWTLCPTGLSPASIVYCFGVGREISFELSLVRRYGLRVFAFDPTPAVADWLRARELPAQFQLVPIGLAGYDGEGNFSPNANPREVSHTLLPRQETAARAVPLPVRRLPTLAAAPGHPR